MTQMRSEILNKILLIFLGTKTMGAWFTEVEKYVQEVGIKCEDIQKRDLPKKKLGVHQTFHKKPELKTGNILSKERI